MSDLLYGLHDAGGQHLMPVGGWVLITEEIGHDPMDMSGRDYTCDHTVIVRLNNGYGSTGTIPLPHLYADFAERCANFVAWSTGCDLWIIGNEPNHHQEWPQGEPITPINYGRCYFECRRRIKERVSSAEVLLAAPGPWNNSVAYQGNERGDWVKYLQDAALVNSISGIDGVALHSYTHGHDPNLVWSNARMAPPFDDRFYHFWAYRDFLVGLGEIGVVEVPIYLTEMNGDDPYWSGGNNGWMRAAYGDLDAWNSANPRQLIRCGIVFRWIRGNDEPWNIESRPGVQTDFRAAYEQQLMWSDHVKLIEKEFSDV